MFAYCGNNPIAYIDHQGSSPVLAATIGGALGGALLSAVFYLNTTDEVTFWGVVGALSVGALTGAMGSWAGMANAYTKWMLIFTSGIISGAYADLTGGSAAWGFLAGALGTYWGTLFDACEYLGFDLAAVNSFFTVFTGFSAEMVSQLGQQMESSDPRPTQPSPNAYTPSPAKKGVDGPSTGGAAFTPIAYCN